ncbi:MAG: GNAT family N-acetyltransferase [Bacteroidetes bacterium]|nr:GNAT family N-acetyltransferase [Bacteroidota bacterium]
MNISINDITIRTDLKAGDIGYITYLHGIFHHNECGYGLQFEAYVAEGLTEFFKNYNPDKERMWICEHNNKIIGSLLLMDRGNDTAQLRYYILEPEYRGIGLGRKLMDFFMEFLKEKNYRQCYLWTTNELKSAAALYIKYGFELSEEKETDDFGKHVTEQRYDLFL